METSRRLQAQAGSPLILIETRSLPATRSYPRHFDLALVLAPATLARSYPRVTITVSMSRVPRRSILTSSFSLLTFPIVPGNKKAAEAFLRAAAFRLIV